VKKTFFGGVAAGLTIFLASCTPSVLQPATQPHLTATLVSQSAATVARATLPPTWTSPPSLTPPPTIAAAPKDGDTLDYDGKATFGWRAVPNGVRLTLTITLHGAKQGIRLDVDTPGDNVVPIPLLRLPDDAGQYDWKMWLQHPVYGEICPYSGTFIRKPLVIM
jgi:hypothetical protein